MIKVWDSEHITLTLPRTQAPLSCLDMGAPRDSCSSPVTRASRSLCLALFQRKSRRLRRRLTLTLFLYKSLLFMRMSRLKLAKFQECVKNIPKAEILLRTFSGMLMENKIK